MSPSVSSPFGSTTLCFLHSCFRYSSKSGRETYIWCQIPWSVFQVVFLECNCNKKTMKLFRHLSTLRCNKKMHKRNKLPKLLPYVLRTHNSNTIFKAKRWHPNQSQQLNSKLYLQIITITRQSHIAYSPYQTAKVVRLVEAAEEVFLFYSMVPHHGSSRWCLLNWFQIWALSETAS